MPLTNAASSHTIYNFGTAGDTSAYGILYPKVLFSAPESPKPLHRAAQLPLLRERLWPSTVLIK